MADSHRCSRCGTSFVAPQSRTALKDLVSGPIRLIRLDEYLTVVCPQCGAREDAVERRFLWGAVGPTTLRWVVALIVALMFLAAICTLVAG